MKVIFASKHILVAPPIPDVAVALSPRGNHALAMCTIELFYSRITDHVLCVFKYVYIYIYLYIYRDL